MTYINFQKNSLNSGAQNWIIFLDGGMITLLVPGWSHSEFFLFNFLLLINIISTNQLLFFISEHTDNNLYLPMCPPFLVTSFPLLGLITTIQSPMPIIYYPIPLYLIVIIFIPEKCFWNFSYFKINFIKKDYHLLFGGCSIQYDIMQ